MDLIANIVNDSIKVETKELEPCLQQVDITIPAEKVESGYNRIAKQVAKEAKLSGFRPGKAPVNVVKNLYKKNIEDETLKELLSASFQKASKDQGDDLLSYSFPKDKSPELKLGTDFTFTLRFNIAPKINIPEYKGIKIELEKQSVDEKEIEGRIDYFREVYGKFEKVDAPASDGDMLKVSYTSDIKLTDDTSDNVKRLANSDMNYVWLNQNDIIPGINKVLKNTKTDDSVKFKSTFPEDYTEKELAGKVAKYKVKVLEVQHKTPIESDEELCTKLMVKNLDELKDRITKQSEVELENSYKNVKRNKVVEVLTKNLNFPVPPDMLQDSTTNELNMLINAKMQGKTDEDKKKVEEEVKEEREKLMKEAKENAAKRLRNFLLLRKIGKEEKIEVIEEEVDKHIQSMSYYYGYKPEDLKKRLIDSGNISQVYDDVLINKVTDFIAENAEVEYIVPKKSK
jgi:trigger factor